MESPADGSSDWFYYSKTVELFRVNTREKDFFITKSQWDGLRKVLDNPAYKDRMIFFGEDGVKAYMIQGIFKEQVNFSSLPEYVRYRVLQETELFSPEVVENFSDGVKKKLQFGLNFLGDG